MNWSKNQKKTTPTPDSQAKSEENYGFIKEERVPQRRWAKRRKAIRVLLIVILLAVLFGVIARCSYEISDYVVHHFFEKDERETVNLRPTPVIDIQPGATTTPIVDEQAFRNYEEIMKGVRLASEVMNPCLTKVIYVREIEDPVFKNVTENATETSGVVIADNGTEFIVLTSYAMFEAIEHDRIRIAFQGGKKAEAVVFAKAPDSDVLLLAVNYKDFRSYEKESVNVVSFGQSSDLMLGSVVIAVGFPNGYGSSVDMGMITSRARKVYIPDTSLEVLETNMPGGRGESGILINTKGELVGVISNRFRVNGQCIEAISIDKLKPQLQYLVNKLDYPEFGATFRDISDEVLSQLLVQNGIIIDSVAENSAAAAQKFRQGDIITAIDDTPVTSVEEFFSIYSTYKKGEEIKIEFYRNGKEQKKSWEITY